MHESARSEKIASTARAGADTGISRRQMMLATAGAIAATAISTKGHPAMDTATLEPAATRGRINHSVCMWCYRDMTVEQMAPVAAKLGLKGIDLLTPEQWAPLKDHGLVCSMTSQSSTIPVGLNRK